MLISPQGTLLNRPWSVDSVSVLIVFPRADIQAREQPLRRAGKYGTHDATRRVADANETLVSLASRGFQCWVLLLPESPGQLFFSLV